MNCFIVVFLIIFSGRWFNTKIQSYKHRNSHYGGYHATIYIMWFFKLVWWNIYVIPGYWTHSKSVPMFSGVALLALLASEANLKDIVKIHQCCTTTSHNRPRRRTHRVNNWFDVLHMAWAPSQIGEIVGCACAGKCRERFPATAV